MSPKCIIGFILFLFFSMSWFRNKSIDKAMSYTLVSGTLFLPELASFRLPLMPALNKLTIPAVLLLIFNLAFKKKFFKNVRLTTGLKFFVGLMLCANVFIVLSNRDTVSSGAKTFAGVSPTAIVMYIVFDCLSYLVTFMVGVGLASRRDWLITFLKTWLTLGLVYGCISYWEAAFAPQLHIKTYGYFQHNWLQVMRDGGYRPIGYMAHSLALALYLSHTGMMCYGLRNEPVRPYRLPAIPLTAFTAVALIITKCSAAFIYFVAVLGLFVLRNLRVQVALAVLVGGLAISMPALRAAGVIPVDDIIQFAAKNLNEERATSLKFRFDNEQMLIGRTMERSLFGWGGNGRAHVFNEYGTDITVVDSAWIIVFSDRGFAGYIGVFGLLAWPLLRSGRGLRQVKDPKDKQLIGVILTVTTIGVLDLMINGLFNNLIFALAGSVWGATQSAWARNPQAQHYATAQRSRRPVIGAPALSAGGRAPSGHQALLGL